MLAQPPDPLRDLLLACELHDPRRLEAVLGAGLDPIAPIGGKTPATWLLEMYTRSDRFTACLRLLLDRGAVVGDAQDQRNERAYRRSQERYRDDGYYQEDRRYYRDGRYYDSEDHYRRSRYYRGY